MQGSIKNVNTGKLVEHIYSKHKLKAKIYEKLKYIQTDGSNSYIDTGVFSNDIGYFKLKINGVSGSGFFGCYIANHKIFYVNSNVGKYRMVLGTKNSEIPSITTTLGTDITLEYNNIGSTWAKLNDQSLSNIGIGDDTNNSLYLGKLNMSGTQIGKTNIYSFEVKDKSGNDFRNYIPVKRIKDNVYGLLDTINNVFYTNASNGTITGEALETPEYIYEEVEQVDYIENTGMSYIDINTNNFDYTNFRLEGRINITTKSQHTWSVLFGAAYKDWNSCAYGFEVEKANNNIYSRYGIWEPIIPNQATSIINKWENFVLDAKPNLQTLTFIDDESNTISGQTTQPYAAPSNISPYLFRCHNTLNSDIFYMVAKLAWFKVYSNEELIRDFIPVKYGTEYCMLDLVESKLYYNVGTEAFTGGNKTEVKKISQVIIDNGTKYYKLDYLENTAQSYIDLGIGCNLIKNIELDFIGTSWSSDQVLYGAYTNTIKGCNYLQIQPSKTNIYGNGSSKALLSSRSPSTTKKCKLTCPITSTGTAYLFEDGVQVGSAVIPSANMETLPMILFTLNLNGSASSTHYTKMKVYSFKGFGLDDKLLFNLIPVEKKDGTKGMIDLVSHTFFGNSGSGTFAGNKREIVLVDD